MLKEAAPWVGEVCRTSGPNSPWVENRNLLSAVLPPFRLWQQRGHRYQPYKAEFSNIFHHLNPVLEAELLMSERLFPKWRFFCLNSFIKFNLFAAATINPWTSVRLSAHTPDYHLLSSECWVQTRLLEVRPGVRFGSTPCSRPNGLIYFFYFAP